MKILPKTLPHLKLCAANYSQLMQIFGGKFLDKSSFKGLDDSASITVTKVFESEHTASLEFKQVDQKNKLNSFLLRICLYKDAKLAEVTSYQGEKPMPFYFKKTHAQSSDEHAQQNLFFAEFLENLKTLQLLKKPQ